MYESCTLCPRACRADRRIRPGRCGCDDQVRIASAGLHKWEEPCICPEPGSGAVFFSGCPLRCVFCQNYEISHTLCGKIFSEKELTELFLSLEKDLRAANINLVTAAPYLPTLVPALKEAKKRGLSIPIVYNSSGYETVLSLQALEGLVDVYLPDLKFHDRDLAKTLASAPDYFDVALAAIREMRRQTGDPQFENGSLRRGVILRHLVLPGHSDDSLEILDAAAREFGTEGVVLSLMSQYVPMGKAKEIRGLDRRITKLEYQKVLKRAEELGFSYVYTQSRDSASEEYVPDFDWKDEKNP